MSHHDERTFVMAKPDAVQRGLKLVGAKFTQIDEELAHEHYAEHEDKPFFEDLVGFITSGPVLAMVWQGADATRQVRKMMGETDGREAAPGTIRGDYGLDMQNNLVHGSDHEDPGANEREVDLFFDEDELVDYERADEAWVYEDKGH